MTTNGKGNADHIGLSEIATQALAEYLHALKGGTDLTTSRVDPGRRILSAGHNPVPVLPNPSRGPLKLPWKADESPAWTRGDLRSPNRLNDLYAMNIARQRMGLA